MFFKLSCKAKNRSEIQLMTEVTETDSGRFSSWMIFVTDTLTDWNWTCKIIKLVDCMYGCEMWAKQHKKNLNVVIRHNIIIFLYMTTLSLTILNKLFHYKLNSCTEKISSAEVRNGLTSRSQKYINNDTVTGNVNQTTFSVMQRLIHCHKCIQ